MKGQYLGCDENSMKPVFMLSFYYFFTLGEKKVVHGGVKTRIV